MHHATNNCICWGGGNNTIVASSVTEETIVCENHTTHDEDCNYIEAKEAKLCGHLQEDGSYSCAPVLDSGSVSDNIASPSESEYVCDHSDDCGYAEAIEGVDCTHECELCKVVEKPDCTCPPVDSGEVTHDKGCPLYEAPAVPEQADAVKNVLALINALPTMAELEEQDVEGEEFPAYLAQLRLDVASARLAFDALTDEEKATFDTASLAKLTELEGVLAAMPVLMSDSAITITVNGTTTVGGADLATAITTSLVPVANITKLTITEGKVTTADWDYIRSLTALTDFKIAAVVTVVAMPNATQQSPLFPNSIKAVSIPQAITIGDYAFSGCTALEIVDFPAATTIGDYTFENCTALASADFPAAINIGNYAFYDCTALKTADFPAATSIGDYAFSGYAALETIDFPAATNIGERAFENCTALASADFPAATSIGVGAFSSCTALESVGFPAATSIGELAFYDCIAIKTINFPLATGIGESAFWYCEVLETARFPVVTSIGANAFEGCALLATLKLPATPPTNVGASAFANCPAERNLIVVNEHGTPLTGSDQIDAWTAYDNVAVGGGGTTDSKWYGWTLDVPEDIIAPTLTAGAVSRTSDSEATVSFSSNEAGTYYYNIGSAANTNTLGTSCDTTSQTISLSSLATGAHDIYIVVQDETGNISVDTFKIAIPAFVPPAITGTVAITGTLKFNQTLTATVSDGSNTGILSYQWKRGGSNIASANSDTYTTVAADVGQTLTCVVTSTTESGSIVGTTTAVIAKADSPAAPTAPTIDYTDETVATLATWEYKLGDTWTVCTANMAATAFGWDGNTAKTVEFRIEATATHEAGAEVSLTIPAKPNAPLASAFTITKPTTIGGTDGRLDGITSDMEYKTGNGTYANGTGAELTGITDGTAYTIRNKATASAFASNTITVTVASKAAYSGTQAPAPSGTPTARTAESITLEAVTVTGETVEYAKSTSATTPTTGWQDSTDFTGLTADTRYYFFARVKENETHMAGTASVGTAITTDKSDAQKLAAAKVLADVALANLTATNSTTADSILSAVNTAIASVPDVTAAWKATPTITKAIDSAAGSITGTIKLTCGGSTAEVTVNLPIAQLAADKPALISAIAAANTAKDGIAVDNNDKTSVANGTRFVTMAEMNALTNAIAAAQAVANNSASTATQVNDEVRALNNAVTAFNTAIKTGTYSGGLSGGGDGGGGGGSSSPSTPPTKPTEPVTGESKANAAVDNKGNTTANITKKNISDAVKAAHDAASKNGVNAGEVTAVINVTSPANSNPNTVSVNLPKTVQEQVISSKIGNVVIAIDKPDISIGMNLDTVTEMNKQAKADIQISATRTDATTLSTEAKNAIGSRPAYDLKATYASGSKSITNFGTGLVSVAIPYTLQKGEIAGGLYAVYVDGNGKVNYITNSSYDAENKVLRFSTNHFSVYGISYKAPIAFTDIANHWAKTDIEFVVNRGLMNGTSNTTFAPNDSMTRGMFVTALGRLSNVDVNAYKTAKFTDVKADTYYAPYVNWAAEKGIVKGITDTTFAPDQVITRQEMAAMMSLYASALGYKVPETRTAVTFADNASIGSWAAPAVKQMQMAGILNGKDGNRFDPTGAATRSEISAMLHRYVELVIDRITTEGFTTNDSGSSLYYQDGKAVTGTKTISNMAYTFNGYGETTRETATASATTNPAPSADEKSS